MKHYPPESKWVLSAWQVNSKECSRFDGQCFQGVLKDRKVSSIQLNLAL